MANVRNGNTYYIDTQYSASEELAVRNIKVTHVVVTTSAVEGDVTLADAGVATKIVLKVAADETTQVFDFSANPLVFSTSIRPTVLSGCVVTCVIQESRA